ncbi:MAG: hypothetical protein JW888_13520 [Pirellulales bacterium]|nr:hypothetical protein [Pirellulales bacterium]
MEAILSQPGWSVRILTKNAAVARDFDLIEKHRDRILVGLSITAPPDKEDVISIIEPNASTISERMAVMREAHGRGLRTYAMLCPLLPGIAESSDQMDEMVRFAVECACEEIFAEPVNARATGLKDTQTAIAKTGFAKEAESLGRIRRKMEWSRYVADLIANIQRSVRAHHDIRKLRVLLYPSGLRTEDAERIRRDDAGVVWLGKK